MRGVLFFSWGLYLSLVLSTAQAHQINSDCEGALAAPRPITLKALREMSAADTAKHEQIIGRPDFFEIEKEAMKEQVGVTGPRALQELLAPGTSFVSTPAPTSPDAVAVNLVKEDYSFPVHVDIPWQGHRTSTTVYASLPQTSVRSNNAYLVGPEYPVVVVHLHGGGTPTATGKNSMSIGEKLGHMGIPVLGPDLPGHGRATRKLKGLETMEGQVDWILDIVEKLVHPNVKVIISGHSWGGEFAAYMHQHALEPKYSRIVRYIALSPPVDTSLEGDIDKKVKFEQWFNHNFNQFAEVSAPADLDFMRNLLVNGKDSDVGGLFATLTDFDYHTPVLSKAEMEARPPRDVVVGDFDLPVRVGREMYDRAFESTSPKSTYTRLGMANTFKSAETGKPEMTGHNIFDAYIDGTTTPFTYNFLTEKVLSHGQQKSPDKRDTESPEWVVNQTFRNYSNFIGFRQMLEGLVEYVETPTAHLPALTSRKTEIDRYLKRVDESEATFLKEKSRKVTEAVEKYRKELGFEDKITLERAQDELKMEPLTAERQAELKAYLVAVDDVEKQMTKDFKDEDTKSQLEAVRAKHAATLAPLDLDPSNPNDYRRIMDPLVKAKNLTPEHTKLRSDLSRFHQEYSQILKDQGARFAKERETRLAKLKAPEGITSSKLASRELEANRSPERRALVQKFVDGYANIQTRAEQEAAQNQLLEINKLARPMYVDTVDQARAQKAEIDAQLASTYTPDNEPELAALTSKVRSLQEQLEQANGGAEEMTLDKQHAAIRETKAKRATALKKWAALWKKGLFQSPGYNLALQKYENALAAFQEAYFGYEAKKAERILALKKAGQATEENILNMPSDLKAMRALKLSTRSEFLKVASELENSRAQDALNGQLQGPEGLVTEAVKVARELWSPEALAALKQVEETYEARLRRFSILQREVAAAKAQYSEVAFSRGVKVPYHFERVVISEKLNQPLPQLLNELRNNPRLMRAFNKVLQKWSDLVSEARLDSESKDTGY